MLELSVTCPQVGQREIEQKVGTKCPLKKHANSKFKLNNEKRAQKVLKKYLDHELFLTRSSAEAV